MDLFQRAAEFLERAQSRMADAANQGTRTVLSAAQMRALEARQAELRRRIEHAALELGKLTFRRWKGGLQGDDPAVLSLCEQLDRYNAEYQYVAGTLANARSGIAPYVPPTPEYSPPPYPPPITSAYPTYPPQAVPLPPYVPPAPSPTYYVPLPYGASASAAALPPAVDQALRPSRPTRECPECFTLVPGSSDFCPTCGMRV